ncbi:MAG: hypothetical protein H7A00_17440, partial [Hahellaceae bacterium]|nr:hypothetical protein [Hahellaceae bacterium]
STLPALATDLGTYTGISTTGTDHAAGNVSAVDLTANGVLTITFKAAASGVPAALAGKKFTLTPTATSAGAVTWAAAPAAASPIDAKYVPKVK